MKNLRLRLSDAIDGFLLACEARQLSLNTLQDYGTTMSRFAEFMAGDPWFDEIDRDDIQRFMASLALPQPVPGAVRRPPRPVSKKTALNRHTGLSALWSWAVSNGAVSRNVVRDVEPPRPEERVIEPFSEKDIKALLAVVERTRSYTRPGKARCDNVRITGQRDKAIIFLLLDTGMRVSELVGLTARQIDLKNRSVYVFGKGDKERALTVSPETAKVVWRYMRERSEARVTDPLFAAVDGSALTRQAVLNMLRDLGERAGVRDCHPHRFRHTYAVTFLRNGGNPYALQVSLGHTTMEMTRRYLSLAQADLKAVHEEASPVSNWRLRA